MALGSLLFGVAAGLLAAGVTLAFGGGLWLAALAYTVGGLAGMLGGLASALIPNSTSGGLTKQDYI